MAEIAWTEEAQRWLEDIFEYIAADSPAAAGRTVQSKNDGNVDVLGVFHGSLVDPESRKVSEVPIRDVNCVLR